MFFFSYKHRKGSISGFDYYKWHRKSKYAAYNRKQYLKKQHGSSSNFKCVVVLVLRHNGIH